MKQKGKRIQTKPDKRNASDVTISPEKRKRAARNRVYTSILLVLLALVAITAATVAWFSIADNTRVRTMSLDIVADVDLRMDLDSHATMDQYVKTLSFEAIAARMQRDKGFSMKETPLEPVTTGDRKTFTYEKGQEVPDTKGAYLTFTLHFMAEKDMTVHLTSADSSAGAGDGTLVSSENPGLPAAMRISFTADGTDWIYDPGMGSVSVTNSNEKTFGLPDAAQMKTDEDNSMFFLKAGVDKAVEVHIWLEGTDPACTDALKEADYAIRLRFTGVQPEEES